MLINFIFGGIDSTLLALLAQKALQDKAKCILFDAPLVPRRAVDEAEEIVRKLCLSYKVIPFPIMENKEFRKNSPDRCYICKKQSAKMLRVERDESFTVIVVLQVSLENQLIRISM